MIVIDIGCANWGGDVSIPHLIEEYEPAVLYGFDPAVGESSEYEQGDTTVVLRPEAAWTFNGEIGFVVARLGGHVVTGGGGRRSRCFDLAEFIKSHSTKDIVLKMDAEGAEYTVLPHLVKKGADKLLDLAVIEWHCEFCGIGGNGRHREGCTADKDWWLERREGVESKLRCPTAEWGH